jgi:nicotinamide-nucleotide amidase
MPAVDTAPKSLLNSELLPQYSIALLAQKLKKDGYMLATAESCTGGLISAACTSLAGSSDWFERGFVTYSNDAKHEQPVARAMAFGAIRHSKAQVSIAVTGVAGPTGGSAAKPVGTVWFGFSVSGALHSEVQCFAGDRASVREQTVRHAFQRVLALLEADPHV